MGTAACHSAQADHFPRRARAPTAGRPANAAESPRPPSPHPGHKPPPLCHSGRRRPDSGSIRRRCLPSASRPPPGLRNASTLYIPRRVSF